MLMMKLAELMESHKELLATIDAWDNGKHNSWLGWDFTSPTGLASAHAPVALLFHALLRFPICYDWVSHESWYIRP
jgi:hypothetical protein